MQTQKPLHGMVVLGTRPEAIKVAPLVREFRSRPDQFRCTVVNTGQHREMLAPMLELFDLRPDFDLKLQLQGQSLEHILSSVLEKLPACFADSKPDFLMVQGDTSTSFAAALSAFYNDIPVVHLEAGLRTNNPRSPFPEEMNRRLTSQIASLHLAPTEKAAQSLRKEGIKESAILMSGNSVVDSLRWLREERAELIENARPEQLKSLDLNEQRMIVVTGHRRENFGEPFRQFCQALVKVSELGDDLQLVYPVHLNPKVQEPVTEILSCHDRIHLLPPVDYPSMLWLMKNATLIISDSGGIQEEAPSFRVPVLVTRENTERMEAVEAGAATLVGTNPEKIIEEAIKKLAQGPLPSDENPFGDGKSAVRCADKLLKFFS